MEEPISFLIDYNKLKAVNVLKNVQAVVWSGYGIFYFVTTRMEIVDRDKLISLYMSIFVVAIFYYAYVLVKYHEYNDKINMYLVRDAWEAINKPQMPRKEFTQHTHEKLLLSEKNISKAIDDLIDEGFFTYSSDLKRK